MKILLTGFEPFGGEQVNPAWEAVQRVPDSVLDADIIKLMVPTVFGVGAEAILQKVEEVAPHMVLSVGQAGGRAAVSVEFVGINYRDARLPDNDGNQPTGECIVAEGENAYFTSLPAKAMVQRIRSRGLPATLSYSAGTYVCNEVLYRLLHHRHRHAPTLKAGFIHVPYAPAQVVNKPGGTPSMGVDDMALALEAAIEAMVLNKSDITQGMGQTE